MSAPRLDSSLMGRAQLQPEGCPIVYIKKFTHHRHRRRRGTVPAHARESATAAYFGCMELLLPPRPFWAAPPSPGSSLLFYAAMRATVQDRRARHRPAPDPTPYGLDNQDCASTSCSGVLGLAGGFQRAVQVDFVATTELSLASAFVEKCLLD